MISAATAEAQHSLSKARQLCEQERFEDGLVELDSCHACSPDSVLYLRAYVCIRQHKLGEAEVLCSRLRRSNKDYYEVCFLKGLLYAMKDNYVMAAEQFTKVLNKNNHHLKALYNRALAEGLLEDYEGAIRDLDTCIALSPDYTAAWYSRGYWRESNTQYDQAIDDYTHTIALDSNYKEAYLALAYAYSLKGERTKACETLEKAINKGSAAANDLKDDFCR